MNQYATNIENMKIISDDTYTFKYKGRSFHIKLKQEYENLGVELYEKLNSSKITLSEAKNNKLFVNCSSLEKIEQTVKDCLQQGKAEIIEYQNKFHLIIFDKNSILKTEPAKDKKVINDIALMKNILPMNFNKYDKAIVSYENYNAEAYNSKGNVLDELKKYKEAIVCYNKALEIDPGYDVAYYNKGNALYNLYKHKEALVCYNKAIKIDLAEAYNNNGNALDELKKHKEAIVCYNKAIEIDPDNTKAYYNKGLALYNLNKYKEAIVSYNKAIKIDPGYANAYNTKGNALSALNKYDEAIVSYNKAIKMILIILMLTIIKEML
jgi:tetratricopeptide (TPR) repeat protein